MAEWRVHAETPDGVATEEAQLERFAESLEQNGDALGAAASMDSGRGTLSATFHVEAPELQEAAWKAFWVYLHAVWDADVVLTADSKLEVQEETRAEEETAELETPATRFRARVQLEAEDTEGA
jgi:hypothetical protein